jgi:adenosylcobinamide-GDP ribazoletransferase
MKFLKYQWHLFATAMMFFTRIPCQTHYSQDSLNRCNRYFPLVGAVVGGIGVLVYWGASFVFPLQVAVLLSMTATILATGAFHEDGFADVCDGFGGGWTQEKILLIMKDSRVGAYGVIGIILLLATKFALLSNMDVDVAILAMITAHVLSRGMAVTTMFALVYVREDETSKVKPISKNLHKTDLVIACVFSLLPLLLWPSWWFLAMLAPLFGIKYFMERWFVKWIGGYTGDCLGTVQQVMELVVYLSVVAIARFVAMG